MVNSITDAASSLQMDRLQIFSLHKEVRNIGISCSNNDALVALWRSDNVASAPATLFVSILVKTSSTTLETWKYDLARE